MPSIYLMSMSVAVALVFAGAAQAQTSPPASPYKAVTIAPPAELNDPALAALRGQIAEATKKRDAAAMARLVVSTGFFLAARQSRYRQQTQIRLRQSFRRARREQQG